MLSPKEFLLQRSSFYINNNGVNTIIPISKKKGILDLTFHSKRIYNSYLLLSNFESIDFRYHVDDHSSIDHDESCRNDDISNDVLHQYQNFESLIRRKISTTLHQYHLNNNEINVNVDDGDDVDHSDDDHQMTNYHLNNQYCDYSSEQYNYSKYNDGYITLSAGKLNNNDKLHIDAMFTARTSVNQFVDYNDDNNSCNDDDDDDDDYDNNGTKNNSNDGDNIEYENDIHAKQHTHHSEFIVDFIPLSRHPVRAKYIRWITERRDHELSRRPFVNESILYHYSSTASSTTRDTAITINTTTSTRDNTATTGA